jgi:hypothetical protein
MTERKLARTRVRHVAPRAVLAAFLWTGYGAPAMAQTQPEMNEDAARSFDKAGAKLNDAYRRLMATLDAADQEKLRRAERACLAGLAQRRVRAGNRLVSGWLRPSDGGVGMLGGADAGAGEAARAATALSGGADGVQWVSVERKEGRGRCPWTPP